MQEGILFGKDPLGSGSYSPSFRVLPQRHRPVHLSVLHKMKCTFEPRTCYCDIHLVYTSVRYERKMHGTNYSKIKFRSKNLVCFNFIEVLSYTNFITLKFSRSTVYAIELAKYIAYIPVWKV